MIQKEIREYNNQQYTKTEGSELIKELDDRTKSDLEGYNSIGEVGTRVKYLDEKVGTFLGRFKYIEDGLVSKGAGKISETSIENSDAVYLKEVDFNGKTVLLFGHIYNSGDKTLYASYTKPLTPVML